MSSDYFICEGPLKFVKGALENIATKSGHGVRQGWEPQLLGLRGSSHVPVLHFKSSAAVWWPCSSSLGSRERSLWDEHSCSPIIPGGSSARTLFPLGHRYAKCLFLLFLSRRCFSQWLALNRLCSTGMTSDSHLTLLLQELSASHLATLDSPNDWENRRLEKHS